jgi:excisionase family DNA binding protein
MNENPGTENASPKGAGRSEEARLFDGHAAEPRAIPFLTRQELAVVLQVGLRTVDAMVAAGEIPTVRLRTSIVRFYLPDVVRQLTATALTRKHGRAAGALEQG